MSSDGSKRLYRKMEGRKVLHIIEGKERWRVEI